jgi:hypothetical protein
MPPAWIRKKYCAPISLHGSGAHIVRIGMKLQIATLLALAAFTPQLHSQDPLPTTYRLQFRFKEVSGTVETSRNYTLMLQSKTRGKINASTRVPFFTSSKGDNREVHTAALGSIIECNVEDRDSMLALDCSFESSFAAPKQPATATPSGFLPVVHSRQATVRAHIPLAQEVRLAAMDDPSSGNRLEIFVVAERALAGRP